MLSALQYFNKLITNSHKTDTEEHQKFLVFFEKLVKEVSSETAAAFGNMEIEGIDDKNTKSNYGIELTVEDFGYWLNAINNGIRFVDGPEKIKLAIYNRMSKIAGNQNLTKEEKETLITLIKEGY